MGSELGLGWLTLCIVLATEIYPSGSACPSFCSCVRRATVVSCRGHYLNAVPPLPFNAEFLDLDHNDISIVRNHTFDDSPNIRVVSLESNGIIHLEAAAFVSLSNLEVLRLGNNRISQLPKNIFYHNRNLEILDLHSNSFTEIPDHVLFPLISLRILNISFNSLTTPMLGPGFAKTKQIEIVDLSGNNLVTLESHVFQANLWWSDDEKSTHALNLSYCNIKHIFPNSLNQLYRVDSLSLEGNTDIAPDQLRSALDDVSISGLEVLNLSNMSLTTIDQYFGTANYRNLAQLVLSHNEITSVDERTFYYLVNLNLLDLSHNSLRRLGSLDGLLNLEYLNLAHNELTRISESLFDGLSLLKVLDLSHNRVVSVDDKPFQTLFDLHSLFLQDNYIESFDIRSGFENLETLSLRSNRLFIVPSVGFLMKLKDLDVSSNGISFLGPNTLSRGQTLKTVNVSHNSISYIDENAFGDSVVDVLDISHNQLTILQNYGLQVQALHLQFNNLRNISLDAFDGQSTLAELNIAHNELSSLPRYSFTPLHSLRSLSMGSNPLGDYIARTKAPHMIFDGLSRVQTLSLANMSLEHVPENLLGATPRLDTLDLSWNKISSLTPAAFTDLQRLTHLDISHSSLSQPDVATLQSLSHLRTIELSENPLQCTCDLIPFRQWLSDTNVSVVTPPRCAGPAEWAGVAVADVHLDQSTCLPHHKLIILIAAGSAALLILMLCILFCVICKCRRRKKRERDKADYCAISYADKQARIHLNRQADTGLPGKNVWV